jgi:hypothetical protein
MKRFFGDLDKQFDDLEEGPLNSQSRYTARESRAPCNYDDQLHLLRWLETKFEKIRPEKK